MSYVAASVDLAVTTLAACAAFQTLTGAADATAALSFIVKTHSGAASDSDGVVGDGIAADGQTIALNTPPYAIIGTDGLTSSTGGVGYWDREGAISIRLVQLRRIGAETPPQATQRAWTVAGDIAAQIEAQIGSGTSFADADVSIAGLFMDDEGANRDQIITEITISFRG